MSTRNRWAKRNAQTTTLTDISHGIVEYEDDSGGRSSTRHSAAQHDSDSRRSRDMLGGQAMQDTEGGGTETMVAMP